MDIKTDRQVEHQSTGELLHVEVFAVASLRHLRERAEEFKVIKLDIPVVFHEQREEVHEVHVDGSTHEREREVIGVGRVAVTAVQEHHHREGVDLVEVGRHGKARGEGHVLGTERERDTVLRVDIFRFTNPDTLLLVVRGSGSETAEHGDIHGLVFRQRETGLQIGTEVTDVTDLGGRDFVAVARHAIRSEVHAVRIVGASRLTGKLVIVNGERRGNVEVVPNADTETRIEAQTGEIVHRRFPTDSRRSRNGIAVRVHVFGRSGVQDFTYGITTRTVKRAGGNREHVVSEGSIAEQGKHEFRMPQRLSRLGFVYTDHAVLVYGLWMASKRAHCKRHCQAHYYSFHRVSLVNRVFP